MATSSNRNNRDERLDGLISGDAPDFSTLYERISPSLYLWASLRLTNELRSVLSPEDLLQEVWLRAIAEFPHYHAARAPFRSWLYGIASKVLLEELRQAHRLTGALERNSITRAESVPERITTACRRLARDEGIQALIAAAAHLKDEERKLLLWRGLEGLSHREVAERLGSDHKVIAKRWERLRARLAGTLARWEDVLA